MKIGVLADTHDRLPAVRELLRQMAERGDGHLGSWGYQQGGMGAVSDSIRRSAESFGAEIRTDARVKKILTSGGRFQGVILEDGTELRAPIGVTCVHPKIGFLDLIPSADLPADFVSTHHYPTDALVDPGTDTDAQLAQRSAGRLRHGHPALEDALGRREDQRRDVGAPRLHGRARDEHAGAPHRLG